MHRRSGRKILAGALTAGALVAPAANAAPNGLTAHATNASFAIDHDQVTIFGVATVNLPSLKRAVDSFRAEGQENGFESARASLAALPTDLRAAVVWEMTHGSESDEMLPPEDFDRNVGTDPEQPTTIEDAPRSIDNFTGANYTAPAPVCTWHTVSDRRQMDSAIFRYTLYRFNIEVTWRGCDNGTNLGAEPFLVWYSDLDSSWTCRDDGTLPRHEEGPYAAPFVKFFAAGQCTTHFKVEAGDTHVEWDYGANSPFIKNTYDWTGKRLERTGSAH